MSCSGTNPQVWRKTLNWRTKFRCSHVSVSISVLTMAAVSQAVIIVCESATLWTATYEAISGMLAIALHTKLSFFDHPFMMSFLLAAFTLHSSPRLLLSTFKPYTAIEIACIVILVHACRELQCFSLFPGPHPAFCRFKYCKRQKTGWGLGTRLRMLSYTILVGWMLTYM